MSPRARSCRRMACGGLLAGLLHAPAAGEPAAWDRWPWPPGTRSEVLAGLRWHDHALDARVLRIPLPIDEALTAMTTVAPAPLRVTAHRGELLLTPLGAAPPPWVLVLRPVGGETAGVLSALATGPGGASAAPSWALPGMQLRLDLADGAGGRQTIHTHAGWSARALAGLVSARLQAQGWAPDGPAVGAVSRWRRGGERLAAVFVDTAAGAGMYSHSEVRASGRGEQE